MFEERGFGWLRDLPDARDYTPQTPEVSDKALSAIPQWTQFKVSSPKLSLPDSVDLRHWCSPVEDQERLGSCTAHAGVGLIEYFENRAFGKHLDHSRLFLYKVTRKLMHTKGDTGAYLRTTMGAMKLFGTPPESEWPYKTRYFDYEPDAYVYALAQNYQAICYFRLDNPNLTPEETLNRIKILLSFGFCSMFGFSVYESIRKVDRTGRIPFPEKGERLLGGHAIIACGFSDTQQSLLIRNSWSADWGLKGYGWLPYEYILQGLTADWWTLIDSSFISTKCFGLD